MRIFYHDQPGIFRSRRCADRPSAKSRFGPAPINRPDNGDLPLCHMADLL